MAKSTPLSEEFRACYLPLARLVVLMCERQANPRGVHRVGPVTPTAVMTELKALGFLGYREGWTYDVLINQLYEWLKPETAIHQQLGFSRKGVLKNAEFSISGRLCAELNPRLLLDVRPDANPNILPPDNLVLRVKNARAAILNGYPSWIGSGSQRTMGNRSAGPMGIMNSVIHPTAVVPQAVPASLALACWYPLGCMTHVQTVLCFPVGDPACCDPQLWQFSATGWAGISPRRWADAIIDKFPRDGAPEGGHVVAQDCRTTGKRHP